MTDVTELEPLRKDLSTPRAAPTKKSTRGGRGKVLRFLVKHAFIILTSIGVLLGFGLGFGIRALKPSTSTVRWLGLPGEIFIRLLKLTILPIIAGNVIIVASKLNPRTNGKVSLISFGYILACNILSPTIGVTFSSIFQPGVSARDNSTRITENRKSLNKVSTSDVIFDLLMNMFPDNIVSVSMFQTQTVYKTELDHAVKTLVIAMNSTFMKNLSANEIQMRQSQFIQDAHISEQRRSSQAYSVNMIGVLFISCTFGIAARFAGEKGKPFIVFFESLTEIVCVIIRAFIWLTPVGACFMIATSIAEVENILETFSSLGLFIATVISALGCHFLLLALSLFVVSGKNPLVVLKPSFRSWFISFATTAPVVAVPEMYEACDKLGISKRVSRFVIPFAASLKGDGSAVFVCASVVFVAQLSGIAINFGTAFIIIFQSTTAALALPNIPSAAIVIIVTIVNSIAVPVKSVALLFALEWLLDRIRSGNMALSHIYCAAFTHTLCENALKTDKDNEQKIHHFDVEKGFDDKESHDGHSKANSHITDGVK